MLTLMRDVQYETVNDVNLILLHYSVQSILIFQMNWIEKAFNETFNGVQLLPLIDRNTKNFVVWV